MIGNIEQLEQNALLTLEQCISYIESNELEKAKTDAQIFIEKCKEILSTEKQIKTFECSDEALLLGILFRSIQNFANLKQMTVSSDWIRNPDLIEEIWVEMWNCKERLEYVSPLIEYTGLEWIFDYINKLHSDFDHMFGHGLYVSPCFLVEKTLCSICGQDIRACEHLPGKIYLGQVCKKITYGISGDQIKKINHGSEMTGNHLLITEYPNDPRCRIWPWKVEKNGDNEGSTFEVVVLHFFKLDDFMN